MPLGTRAPSFSKRVGSDRNSTISSSSMRGSSRPATSSHRTRVSSRGSIVLGFVDGIALTSFQVKNAIATNASGIPQ